MCGNIHEALIFFFVFFFSWKFSRDNTASPFRNDQTSVKGLVASLQVTDRRTSDRRMKASHL